MKTTPAWAAAVACGAAVLAPAGPVASADEVTLTFSDLTHGEVLENDRYEDLGVLIDVQNWRKSFDFGVGFDTTMNNTRDSDLEAPFDSGNLAGVGQGTVLIIQENNKVTDGVATKPDDEGGRPAGSFTFDFLAPTKLFGVDLIDIEGPQEYGNGGGYVLTVSGQGQSYTVEFSDFITPTSPWYDPTIAYGDNSANRAPTLHASDFGLSGFDRVEVALGGSGAIDNVVYHAVPSPTAALAGLAMAGGMALRRRRPDTEAAGAAAG